MKKLLSILLLCYCFSATAQNALSFDGYVHSRKSEKAILLTDSLKMYFEQKEKKITPRAIIDSTKQVAQILSLNPDKHLPYPILFVHGLAGDSHTWLEMTEWLEPALGETIKLDFSLNSDGTVFYSNMVYDVQSFIPSILASANLYKITFNCNSSGDCFYGGSTSSNYSNQAGITKQGKAIGIAVNSILEATGKSRVVLIGHSMGGLAIREYLQNDIHWIDDSHNVAKLITVGTPNCGADIEYGGFDWVGSDLGVDIRATSEAVRDLRSQYDFFGLGVDPGAFIWGGIESQSYMNDNLISSWDNVDVTCNGVDYESVTGINERSIYSGVEYASIRDYNDDVVSPSTADYNWTDEETGGEDLCSVLSHWGGEENRHCENWNIDAIGWMGGHSALPGELKENLWALDEADGPDLSDPLTRYRAYEINLGIDYAGFVTPQGHNLISNLDVDNYRVYIPGDGVLDIDVSFHEGTEGDDFYLWEENSETYINAITSVSDEELMSTEVTEGYYFVQFYGSETEEEQFSQYYFSLNFDAYGCVDISACNYNTSADIDDGTCMYPEEYYSCDGTCINDFDFDGECDEFDYDDGLGIDAINAKVPKLIKMIDVLGRIQKVHKKGMLLFYVYDNGTVEKKIFH